MIQGHRIVDLNALVVRPAGTQSLKQTLGSLIFMKRLFSFTQQLQGFSGPVVHDPLLSMNEPRLRGFGVGCCDRLPKVSEPLVPMAVQRYRIAQLCSVGKPFIAQRFVTWVGMQ